MERMGFIEWFLIGYEEYRRGHNYLLEHGLSHLVPAYHAAPDYLHHYSFWLPDRLKLADQKGQNICWPPNGWHWQGLNDCQQRYLYRCGAERDILHFGSDGEWTTEIKWRLEPILDYRLDPEYYPIATDYSINASRVCDWCGKQLYGAAGIMASDVLQVEDFCSIEHLMLHREKLLSLPETQYIRDLYDSYQFQHIPPDPLRLKAYCERLPSHFDETRVAHKPVCMPVVERSRPIRCTAEELSNGNPKGYTCEDD